MQKQWSQRCRDRLFWAHMAWELHGTGGGFTRRTTTPLDARPEHNTNQRNELQHIILCVKKTCPKGEDICWSLPGGGFTLRTTTPLDKECNIKQKTTSILCFPLRQQSAGIQNVRRPGHWFLKEGESWCTTIGWLDCLTGRLLRAVSRRQRELQSLDIQRPSKHIHSTSSLCS